jgi:hypothetical protein
MENAMALSFPNISRSYDSARQSVFFWGYDSAFEVSFHVNREALQRVAKLPCTSESDLLHAFDTNRPRIHEVAAKAYSRRGGNYLGLLASDF